MRSWARWMAVGLAAVSAITQVGVLPAFPLWALIVIGPGGHRDLWAHGAMGGARAEALAVTGSATALALSAVR
jgi:hypothetical protein